MKDTRDILRIIGVTASALAVAWFIVVSIWRFTSPAALVRATAQGDDNQVRLLLARGADPNARNAGEPYTALDNAAVGCNAQTIELMIEKGADVNQKNGHGWTPLHFAAVHNHMDIAKVLLPGGADFNAKDDNGETPIMMAADRGHVEMVRFLLNHQADPKGALDSAISRRRTEVIQYLNQRNTR